MDVRINICYILTIERTSPEQLFSICEYFELLDPDICSFSDLEIDDNLRKKFRTQVMKLEKVREISVEEEGEHLGNVPIRFCFDYENKFICLSNKLSPGTHSILLPKVISKQLDELGTSLIFMDHIKLLSQICATTHTEDYMNQTILLPWYVLTTVQLLTVSKLFKVTIDTAALTEHESSLSSLLKPLCATSETFISKGFDVNDFNSALFAFPYAQIFNCSYVLLAEKGSYTAIVSANQLEIDLNSESLSFMDINQHNGKLSRSLRSNAAQKKTETQKVVSAGSTETFTATQLNCIISHFNLDLPMVGKKNLSLVSRKFFLCQFYQQQLINSPLDINVYCFDGQSNFVCMLQELNAPKHEIVVTSKQKELYNFEVIPPDYDDLRKILLQTFISQTNYVIELPWIALTRSQMYEIAKDKCPGLNTKKVLASKNIPGFLSGAIKQSSEYKNNFREASKFDSCLTFGISVEEPLLFCDWSVADTTDIHKQVSMYKELFGRKISLNETLSIVNVSKSCTKTHHVEQMEGQKTPAEVCTILKDTRDLEYSFKEKETEEPEENLEPKLEILNNELVDHKCQKVLKMKSANVKSCDFRNSHYDIPIVTMTSQDNDEIFSDSESTSSSDNSYVDSVSEIDHNSIDSSPETPNYPVKDSKLDLTNELQNSTESYYNSCTGTPTNETTDDPLITHDQHIRTQSPVQNNLDIQNYSMGHLNANNTSNTFSGSSQLASTEDSEISVSSPYSFMCSRPNCKDMENIEMEESTPIKCKYEVIHPPISLSSTPKQAIDTTNTSEPSFERSCPDNKENRETGSSSYYHTEEHINSHSEDSNVAENFVCAQCKEEVELDDILDCFICCDKVHYSCYKQEKTGRPIAFSYHKIACKHLNNHKWFCNDCYSLPKEKVIKKFSTNCIRDIEKPVEGGNHSLDHGQTNQTPNHIDSNVHSPPSIVSSSKELLEQKNPLEDVQFTLQTILNHQAKIEDEVISIKKLTECKNDQSCLCKGHKKVLKIIKENTETLCQLDNINKNIAENKEMLKNLEEQIECTNNLASTYVGTRPTMSNNIDGPDTYNQVKKSLYSSKIQNQGSTQTGSVYTKNHHVRTTVVPRKTVIISRDIDKALAKGSDKIRAAFNKHFKNMEIENCFVSKGGSVFIELTSEEDALSVLKTWKKEFFTDPKADNVITACTIFANMQNSILLKGVSVDFHNDELTDLVRVQFPGALAKRFVRRDGTRLSTVKVDFSVLSHKKAALKEGIKINHTIITAEDFVPRQRIIQCYNCFKYGHVAKLCHQKHPTCQICAGNHSQDECHQQSSKCRNCQSPNHYATSRDCPVYKEAMNSIRINNMKYKEESHHNNVHDDF